jgi:glycolate oxidase
MDLDPDAAALVFARSDEGGGTAEIAWMERTCEAAGAALVVTSDEEAEGRMLLAARRLAYPALERRGATLLDDVAVPVGAIPAFLAAVQAIAAAHGVLIATFGHAGDGNMHPTIVYDHHDADEVARARAAFAAIVRAALQLGGTITGEHGVGLLKRPYLVDEIGPDALDLSRDIKRVWDPDGRMNPGKML